MWSEDNRVNWSLEIKLITNTLHIINVKIRIKNAIYNAPEISIALKLYSMIFIPVPKISANSKTIYSHRCQL